MGLNHPCLPPPPKPAQGHQQMVCVDFPYLIMTQGAHKPTEASRTKGVDLYLIILMQYFWFLRKETLEASTKISCLPLIFLILWWEHVAIGNRTLDGHRDESPLYTRRWSSGSFKQQQQFPKTQANILAVILPVGNLQPSSVPQQCNPQLCSSWCS